MKIDDIYLASDLNISDRDLIAAIREVASNLMRFYRVRENREMSIAIQNLEQSIMWAMMGVVQE